MEIHPLHQVSQRFWLKRSQSRIADLPKDQKKKHDGNETNQQNLIPNQHPQARLRQETDLRVRLKVPVIDGLDQLLSDLDNFLLACCSGWGGGREEQKFIVATLTLDPF